MKPIVLGLRNSDSLDCVILTPQPGHTPKSWEETKKKVQKFCVKMIDQNQRYTLEDIQTVEHAVRWRVIFERGEHIDTLNLVE